MKFSKALIQENSQSILALDTERASSRKSSRSFKDGEIRKYKTLEAIVLIDRTRISRIPFEDLLWIILKC
jgi:hypothetical protein